MKIILLMDVPKVGKRHEIKEVADGFARNVLLPSKKAILATPEKEAEIKRQQIQKAQSLAQEDRIFSELAEQIQTSGGLVISAKAGPSGHLFASIKIEDVIIAAKDKGFALKKEWLNIPESIKSVGKHLIELKRGGKIEKIELNIVAK